MITARRIVRDAATRLDFGPTDVTRIVTAASELARNIYQYAGFGVMRWRPIQRTTGSGIELTFEDHGPGIANVEQARQRGFSTSRGKGLGLPGAERLMDEMEIWSQVGIGTTVVVRKWLRM